MKKALMPIVIILAVAVLLIFLARCYEDKYGASGPFHSKHGHGHEDDEEQVLSPKSGK